MQVSSWAYGLKDKWAAKWIGAPVSVQQNALSNLRPEDKVDINAHPGLKPSLYFRKQIRVDLLNIKQVRVYATARGLYRAYYNGRMLTFGDDRPELTPGWTDYNQSIHYQVYDVTYDTTENNITVGAVVSPGWYSGYVGSVFGFYGKEEFLLMEIHVDYKNGVKMVYTTDETWEVTTGPLIYSDILLGELFYENRQLNNFMTSDSYNATWFKAVTQPLNPKVKLLAEAYQGVTVVNFIPVKTATQISPDVWVYDFGVNFGGYVSISLPNFSDNITIQVRHGEMLDTNGTLYTLNLRFARAIDTYVLNGKYKYTFCQYTSNYLLHSHM